MLCYRQEQRLDLNAHRQTGCTRTLTGATGITEGGLLVVQCLDTQGAQVGWIAWPAHLRH